MFAWQNFLQLKFCEILFVQTCPNFFRTTNLNLFRWNFSSASNFFPTNFRSQRKLLSSASNFSRRQNFSSAWTFSSSTNFFRENFWKVELFLPGKFKNLCQLETRHDENLSQLETLQTSCKLKNSFVRNFVASKLSNFQTFYGTKPLWTFLSQNLCQLKLFSTNFLNVKIFASSNFCESLFVWIFHPRIFSTLETFKLFTTFFCETFFRERLNLFLTYKLLRDQFCRIVTGKLSSV